MMKNVAPNHWIRDIAKEIDFSADVLENDENLAFSTEATIGSPPAKRLCLNDKDNNLPDENLAPEILQLGTEARGHLIPVKSVQKYNGI
uniref:Uncharacterized protein n=1 Tax=Bracon brevicornis TaxID=1563983 RepID=A0A6V7HXD2_9HYME